MKKQLLSLREASSYLAMSLDYIFGRAIRFDFEELTEWVGRARVEQDA